jgi:hypothetical protein
MTNEEIKNASKDLYRIFGKVRKLKKSDLKDPRADSVLEKTVQLLSDASIHLESLTHVQILKDPNEYIDFMQEMDKIKRTEVFFQL